MVHEHTINDYGRAFAIGVGLNIFFVTIEAGYGIFAGSLALLADAGHNLTDVFSLLLAWGATWLAARATTRKRTYGFRKATVISSLASGALLLVAIGGITWEAALRFFEPQPVTGIVVIVVAAIGVVINTATAMLFFSGRQHDLNIKGAFLHMAADAGVSLGVVASGLIIILKGWLWIDPLMSLIIAAIILLTTWGLLRDSINYAMDAVPADINLAEIETYLNRLKNVSQIHDLHVWPLSTTEVALTVHLVVTDDTIDNDFLHKVQHDLHDLFGIEHTTIQVEYRDGRNNCMLNKQTCTQKG